LYQLLGKTYTDKQFEELCFQFGVELDDVTTANEIHMRETKGAKKKDATAQDDEVLYKIDCPANRYDLLSTEGMATALRVFLGMMTPPRYQLLPMAPNMTMKVSRSVVGVRDFVMCAVLRNIAFTPESYNSFIDLQEKLHQSLARKRTLVSAGTHDLDKVQPPFTYEATPRAQIKFVPLKQTTFLDCTGDGLERYYKDDKHIGKFVSLLTPFDNYPVVYDSKRTIMSLPPIINSDVSQISIGTKNVFIECTAIDKKKAEVMLNLIVSSFSMYCEPKFHIEPVRVIYEGGAEEVTPNLSARTMRCNVKRLAKQVGIQEISGAKTCELLAKMQLECKPSEKDPDEIDVTVPITRPDILHECDVMEDVAIAYGYDNLEMKPVPTLSVGTQTPVGKLTHLVRLELAAAGYSEMLTLSMCSHNEAFKFINRVDDGKTAVRIANPQTIEFEVCRPTLLPGTLKTLNASQNHALPIQLFEVTDVVLLDSTARTGCRNERRIAVLHCSSDSSGFESIHGVLDYLMGKLGAPSYEIRPNPSLTTSFMDGRGAEIMATFDPAKGPISIGQMGVVHPQVLTYFQIPLPCAYLEIVLTPFI
jgi:phenylalanyl-tRNA synthetase beta chain